jgi:hypothetical protein
MLLHHLDFTFLRLRVLGLKSKALIPSGFIILPRCGGGTGIGWGIGRRLRRNMGLVGLE